MSHIFCMLQKIRIPFPLQTLLLMFVTCFFVFGILLSNLGFFQDDWHHVYYGYQEGIQGLKAFFYTDSRPLAYHLYILLFQTIGFNPTHWHWFVMILRLLSTIIFWFIVRMLWPAKEELAGWLGLFFALHPIYTLQPLAVAYMLHWVSYLSILASFALMLVALKTQNRIKKWWFSSLALLLQVYHLVMIEYFAGLEIVRIFLLWLSQANLFPKERIKLSFRLWTPYLIVLILYVGYRLSYSQTFGYDRSAPIVLFGLINTPLTYLLPLSITVIKDLIYVTIPPWYTIIDPSVLDLTRPSTWYLWVTATLFGLLTFSLFLRIAHSERDAINDDRLALTLIVSGVIVTILSLLPSWLVGFQLTAKNPLWSNRLALPALPGLSLLVVGVGYFFVSDRIKRTLLFSLLLMVAFASHITTAREFKESWEKQRSFYWQLRWRAPTLKPGTFVVADNEILFYMGDYPTSYALNLLYPKTTDPPEVDYWFNPGSANLDLAQFSNGKTIEISKYSSLFKASKERVLAIMFEPSRGQCLWLLRPEYLEIRHLTPEAYRWMSFSDISQVVAEEAAFAQEIFGLEPYHQWCYYYQKADLAAQLGDWKKVLSLWEMALSNHMRPSSSVELLPFIEAYAQTAEWKTAYELTLWANTLSPRATDLLCTNWRRYKAKRLLSGENALIFSKIKEDLNCQD